jgi:hypothetical protein
LLSRNDAFRVGAARVDGGTDSEGWAPKKNVVGHDCML